MVHCVYLCIFCCGQVGWHLCPVIHWKLAVVVVMWFWMHTSPVWCSMPRRRSTLATHRTCRWLWNTLLVVGGVFRSVLSFCFIHAPRSVTDNLQRVKNAAARLVSGTRKYDRGLSHVNLHWLDVADHDEFKLSLTVHRCLSNKAPHYLADSCTLVSDIASRQRLRLAQRRHLDVPRHNRSTLGRRSFSFAGPTVWNSLPDELRDQGCTESTFKQSLKTYLFAQH